MIRPGDRVALFAPAGAVPRRLLLEGLKVLEGWGLEVRFSERLFERHRYLAGSDDSRAEELKNYLREKKHHILWAARGGFGSARLLPALKDLRAEKDSPALFGFSDLTAILNFLASRGFEVWHAPTVCFLAELPEETRETLRRLLFGEIPLVLSGTPLFPGETEGPLYGGNLATLSALLGTPYLPDLKGAILLLEDTGEALYRLDRYLSHLALAGIFERINGLILGDLGHPPESWRPILEELLPPGIPVAYGFPLGHISRTLAFLLGRRARLKVTRKEARLSQTHD